MSYLKAKMHQIRFRLGLRPRPRLDLRGPTSKGRGEKGGREGKGEGRRGRGRGRCDGRGMPPPFRNPKYATGSMHSLLTSVNDLMVTTLVLHN